MFTLGLTFFMCFLTCYLNYSAAKEEKAEPGEDVVLHCQGPRDADIEMLEWIKPDLKSDDYVLFVRDNHRYDNYQHPSFHGRVKLRDPGMKDGDASVILRNVTMKDAGTYQCHVRKSNSHRSKRSAPELMNSITLKVEHLDHIDITAKHGDEVVLPGQDFSSTPVTGVKWIRPHLNQAGYVFLSRHGQSVPDNQHPYHWNLAELKDNEMKNGDMSLILKNVMTVDSGTYHCYVNQGGTMRKKRSINLYVAPPGPNEDEGNKRGGDKDEGEQYKYAGLALGLAVVVFLIGFSGFMLFQKLHPKKSSQKVELIPASSSLSR